MDREAGGRLVGAVTLTGRLYSAKLNPTEEHLHELRQKHDADFQKWWKELFGHAFDCLTQSETRHFARSPDVDIIRNRLAAAVRQGSGPSRTRSPREQRERIKDMKTRLVEKDLPELMEATDRMANTFDKRSRSDGSFGIPAIPLNPARSKPA